MGVAALGIWLWAASEPAAREEPLALHLVATEKVSDLLLTTGLIKPAITLDVRAEASGLVEAVLVREGDRVTRGQILARLSSALPRSALEEAEANLRQVQLTDEATASEIDTAGLEIKRRAHARLVDLHARGLVPRNQVETSELELRQAERAIDRGRRSRVKSYAAIEEARAGTARARAQLDRTIIRAPFDAVVLRQFVTVGSGVSAIGQSASGGTILFTIGDRHRSAFYARVTAADAARMRPGLVARIKTDQPTAATLEGRVLSVSTSGDLEGPPAVSTFPIVVALSDTPATWINVPARAEIVVGETPDAVVVPVGCVWTDEDGQPYVRIMTPEGPVRRNVRLGSVEPARLQIADGLSRGETIGCR